MKPLLLATLLATSLIPEKNLSGAQDTPGASLASILDPSDYWRRTAHGWQWMPPTEAEVIPLRLHPLTLAAFILLASLLALLLGDHWRSDGYPSGIDENELAAPPPQGHDRPEEVRHRFDIPMSIYFPPSSPGESTSDNVRS